MQIILMNLFVALANVALGHTHVVHKDIIQEFLDKFGQTVGDPIKAATLAAYQPPPAVLPPSQMALPLTEVPAKLTDAEAVKGTVKPAVAAEKKAPNVN